VTGGRATPASPDASSAYPPPERLAFPDAECALPWLARLLNAHHRTDQGVHEGDDAWYIRPQDVMKPIRRFADEAFYGINDRHERREVAKTGRIHALAKVLQALDWTKLAQRMEAAPARRGASVSDSPIA
jgi:hypothetical protein